MGDEDMRDFENVTGGKGADIAQIEKQCPVFMTEGNE
jgi:hypothetical protein